MKKKPIAEPIISPEILDMAKKSVDTGRPAATQRCAVCGSSTTQLAGPPNQEADNLCWVCRRLKLSAWRENDQQLSAQE